MSDVDGGITRPQKDGKKLYKIKIEGKLSDAEWEQFKTRIDQCVKQFPTKLKITFIP
jgi:hypothetical protein